MNRTIPKVILLTLLLLPIVTPLLHSFSPTAVENSNSLFLQSDEDDFIRGPTVNLVTNNSATIFWRTADSTDATVHYGLEESLSETTSNSTLDTDHLIELTGLQADSTYYYKVESNSFESEMYNFKTAPEDGKPFKMVCIGDNRPTSGTEQPEVFAELIDMIMQEEPHLVIMTGDFVYKVDEDPIYNEESWSAFTNITDRLGHYAPIYGVIGNHDIGTDADSLQYFFDAFVLPDETKTYYSLDYAGVHFSFLNTYQFGVENRITGTQYDWLVNDLSTSDSFHRFVIGHSPVYPVTHIGSSMDINEDDRDRLQELFEDENVTAYVCGHDHSFDRMTVNGVTHVITGGGGAPLYTSQWGTPTNHYVVVDVSPGTVDFKPTDTEENVFRRYTLPYTGPIEISVRVLANGSTRAAGSMPEVYFSEVPEVHYYSWDGGANTTDLTGLPAEGFEHILNIYAQDDEGIWSHVSYVLNTAGQTPSSTPAAPLDMTMLAIIGAGIAVVVVVVVVILVKRK